MDTLMTRRDAASDVCDEDVRLSVGWRRIRIYLLRSKVGTFLGGRARRIVLAALLLGCGAAKLLVPHSDKYYMPFWGYYGACAAELVLGMMVLLGRPRITVIVAVTAGALVASALSPFMKEDCGCLPVTHVHSHELRTAVAALMAALGLATLRDMVR